MSDLNLHEAAGWCGLGVRAFSAFVADGLIPPPDQQNPVRWKLSTLQNWLDAGCPQQQNTENGSDTSKTTRV